MLTLRDKEEATKHEEEVGILRRIIQKYGKHQQGGLRGRFQSHGGHRSGDELGQDGQFLGSFVQGGGDIILKAQRF